MKKQITNPVQTLLIQTFLKFATLGMIAFGITGCGGHLLAEGGANSEGGGNFGYYQSDANGDFTCSTDPNVMPPDDQVKDGTQRYFACPHSTSFTKILVRGYSSTDRYVCAFPVQYLDEESFVYKLDQFGAPLYTCYDAWANNSVEVNFNFTNYNGVLMVDKTLRSQMSSCLVSGQNCPMHAIGRFR